MMTIPYLYVHIGKTPVVIGEREDDKREGEGDRLTTFNVPQRISHVYIHISSFIF